MGGRQSCPLRATVSPHMQTRQGTHLANIAQLDFDSDSFFRQVPCSVNNLHNRMVTIIPTPGGHKAIYEQQNHGQTP